MLLSRLEAAVMSRGPETVREVVLHVAGMVYPIRAVVKSIRLHLASDGTARSIEVENTAHPLIPRLQLTIPARELKAMTTQEISLQEALTRIEGHTV